MKITFVSNYINHHQIPFSKAMCAWPGVEYTFIQTEPMEEERVRMGWKQQEDLPYLKLYYREPQSCRALIAESDVVIFGGCEDEAYIAERLKSGKPVIRYSERLYKEGQWKAISPRGLWKKYHDHVKYRNAQVYLLCSGAYVADDFHIIRAYPDKMFRWGYFPETKHYDVDQLMAGKGSGENKRIAILWAARMIDWKHPELVVQTAHYLKQKGIEFHLTMAGGGEMEEEVRRLAKELQVTDCISFPGFCSPTEVRTMMEQADIYLVTSDRGEGWGAVVNEAMNSGCAVVADHMIGAVPYLIRHGENGLIYEDKNSRQLFELTAWLAQDRSRCRKLGEQAYHTITKEWNPENAAACLMELIGKLKLDNRERNQKAKAQCAQLQNVQPQNVKGHAAMITSTGPCSPAPMIREKKMYEYLTKERK